MITANGRLKGSVTRGFRRVLHANPRVSNDERDTANLITDFLSQFASLGVTLCHSKVGGGHGLVYQVKGRAQPSPNFDSTGDACDGAAAGP